MTTENEKLRIIQALKETELLLAKEEAYMEAHQKKYLIISYQSHISKLAGMLT